MKRTSIALLTAACALASAGCITPVQVRSSPHSTTITRGKITISISEQELQAIWEKAQEAAQFSLKDTEHPPVSWIETYYPNTNVWTYTYGVYHTDLNTIDIYGADSFDAPVGYNSIEMKTFLLTVTAHEYFHAIYVRKYPHQSVYKFHHCTMISSGDLEKTAAYIETLTGSKGYAKAYTLEITEKECQNNP